MISCKWLKVSGGLSAATVCRETDGSDGCDVSTAKMDASLVAHVRRRFQNQPIHHYIYYSIILTSPLAVLHGCLTMTCLTSVSLIITVEAETSRAAPHIQNVTWLTPFGPHTSSSTAGGIVPSKER